MKRFTLFILFILPLLQLFGQEITPVAMTEGRVSYITQQNIYVKFEQSGMIQPLDTIFMRKDQLLTPLFIAESVSSTSCVGKPLGQFELKIADVVYARTKMAVRSAKSSLSQNIFSPAGNQQDNVKTGKADNLSVPVTKPAGEQKIRGRLSASSYTSFSNSSAFNQRMRYTFTLAADHISDSKFSTDTYILFTHQLNHWGDVKSNIFNALKIYSLSVNYDVSKNTRILVGRKINLRLASIGAIDGLQAETSFNKFTVGAVVGTNPDYTDYSFNARLFEYGAYLAHDIKNTTGQAGTSIAFMQQTNRGSTDRRFVYFQHDNSLIKNLNLFVSCEVDLYALKKGIVPVSLRQTPTDSVSLTPTNTISLTSIYLSLRYRFSRKLSASVSYDARKNVIYYETFKTYLDQMLLDATRQGYQLRINYNPGKLIYSGLSGGYQVRTNDLNAAYNANGFLTFSQVPGINSSVSLSSNWLKSSYVDGMIYGIRIYRDLIPSHLSSGINYRLVDYKYLNITTKSIQHMAELELSWQINRKFSLSADYDGTFEKSNQYTSIYLNLIKRF